MNAAVAHVAPKRTRREIHVAPIVGAHERSCCMCTGPATHFAEVVDYECDAKGHRVTRHQLTRFPRACCRDCLNAMVCGYIGK